jgi:hypothetical protein
VLSSLSIVTGRRTPRIEFCPPTGCESTSAARAGTAASLDGGDSLLAVEHSFGKSKTKVAGTLLRAPEHDVAVDRILVPAPQSVGPPLEVERRLNEDACPFARPFPVGFDTCPEFRPTLYLATDLSHRVLAEVITCKNLTVGGDGPGGYYPRCNVGWPARRDGEASNFR